MVSCLNSAPPPWSTCCGAHPPAALGLRETPESGGDRPWGVAVHRDTPSPPWVQHPGWPQAHSCGGPGGRGTPPRTLLASLPCGTPAASLGSCRQSRGCCHGGPWTPRSARRGWGARGEPWAAWTALAGTPSPALDPSFACPPPFCFRGDPVLAGTPGQALGDSVCSRGPFPSCLLRPWSVTSSLGPRRQTGSPGR